jgi:hypothetical protein
VIQGKIKEYARHNQKICTTRELARNSRVPIKILAKGTFYKTKIKETGINEENLQHFAWPI